MIKLFSQKEEFASENGLITPKNKNLFWAFGLVAGSWLICLLISGVVWIINNGQQLDKTREDAPKITKFASESEFRSYLNTQPEIYSGMMGLGVAKTMDMMAPAELPTAAGMGEQASRYSETNVQVLGIDEPDLVKTDGKNIFVSSEQRYYMRQVEPVPMMIEGEIGIIPPDQPQYLAATSIIQALPVTSAKKIADVNVVGDLLVTKDRLIVFENQKITGFDISNPEKPIQTWELEFSGNRQIETARLLNNQLVLITKLPVYPGTPCPMPLWNVGSATKSIACTDIYRPLQNTNVNTTYTVSRINPETGDEVASTTLVGSQDQTVVYVSNQAIYVTFTTSKSQSEMVAEVLLDDTSSLINQETKIRLKKVFELDISQAAKQVEIEQILAEYTTGLNDDDRMKWEAEMTNQMNNYADSNKRQIEKTIIAKIDIDNLNIVTTGMVPGRPLNQFSVDEYQDYLRIATTVGGRNISGAISGNDVYVLDKNLVQTGSVMDLGKDERVYAVRFMGNRGFVVTFKETDPLYALDLSNPKAPMVTGELKIPGYSSYLHPLKEHLLVGIGKEDNQVKVSLFDVADASQPKEIDKYALPDYWSEISSTHHAFLQDTTHEIFFIPGETGGYIFSYADNSLKLVKTVALSTIKRAIYINDYLYLVGEGKITIISEDNWQTVKTLEW